jgi:glycine cleavage system aminomethyltransferase T
LETGIALALVTRDAAPAVGEKVQIEVRGRMIAGDIVKPPFIHKR